MPRVPASDSGETMRAIMRPPQNLLELPYSFTQLPLLTPDEFLRAAVDRGLHATRDDLQALHRLGLLVPRFRVRRDGRAVTRAARRHAVWGRQAGGSHPTTRADLLEARARRALLDPLHEAFVGHRRMTRETYGVQYQASEYVYSHHQLSLVSIIRQLKPFLSYQEPDGRAPRLHQKAYWDLFVRPRMAVVAGLLVPLSALDPIYYPDIIGTFAGGIEELEQYHNWRDELGGHSVVQWLGVTPDWLKSQGQQLLHIADSIDPLGGWRELVREASPSTWKQLRADARAAVDLRIGAEILLSHYDEIVNAGGAPALPKRTGRERTPFDTRLKPRGHVDRLLTDFGLSPQPRLVLVVEGATELLIFPKLMEHFEIRTDREFIAIEDREGVGKDIASLVAYAIAPPTEVEEAGRYLVPLRPLTRLLVVNDAEGPMATSKQRGKQRDKWIDRVLRNASARAPDRGGARGSQAFGPHRHLETERRELRVRSLHRSAARERNCVDRSGRQPADAASTDHAHRSVASPALEPEEGSLAGGL